jgi:hypothetical protein
MMTSRKGCHCGSSFGNFNRSKETPSGACSSFGSLFFLWPLSLGTDCVKIQEAADESKGIFPCSYCSRFVFLFSILFAHIC